jgi:hypothetical protein
MGKSFYYIAKTVQVTGIVLVLHSLIVSAALGKDMGFLYTFTIVGMGIFMAGWLLQKIA